MRLCGTVNKPSSTSRHVTAGLNNRYALSNGRTTRRLNKTPSAFCWPSSVSCQTMPSRLTLVPGWQGPRQAGSPSSAPEIPPSWVLVPMDRVLTVSCFGLKAGRAGGEKEGVEGREGPGPPGWPGAGGVNMGSIWKEKEKANRFN